jgi:hypothetical protein
MKKLIFYIKAFFLVIKYLLKRGYEPAWLQCFDPDSVMGTEAEFLISDGGGVEEFAKLIVKEIQLKLYLDYFRMGQAWEYRDGFYYNYLEHEKIKRKQRSMSYRLTDKKKSFNGNTLYQIKCVKDCKYAKKGELGGYIASYDNLEDGAWVHFDSCVCDSSIVRGYLKGGFAAKNSVVEGVVRGVVINSHVDADSELDYAIVVKSKIVNTRYKAELLKAVSTVALIMHSELSNSELKGNITISYGDIRNSTIDWNNVDWACFFDDVPMKYVVNEEDGSLEPVVDEERQLIDERKKLKKEWAESVEALLNKKEIKTEDEEGDSLFNENNNGRLADEEEMLRKISEVKDMADYYKALFGEIMYDSLMEAVEHKGYDGF